MLKAKGFWAIKFPDGEYHCQAYFNDRLMFLVVPLVLALITSGSKKILRIFSTWEGRSTIAQQKVAAINAMALLNIINIGFVLFLVNFSMPRVRETFGFMRGEYRIATPSWFKRIGVKIVFTMGMMLFTIHGSNAAWAGCCALKRKRDRGFSSDKRITKTLTQFDYEDMNTGPEFMIDYKYANMITWLFVVFVYGAGMPILFPLGAFNFFITYWIDKYLLLSHYKKPPMFDIYIVLHVISWFKYALFFHFLITQWFFINTDALPSKNNSAFRLN